VRRSKAELEAIYESAPVMIMIVNRNGRVERINRAMTEFLGGREINSKPHGPGDIIACVNAIASPSGCGQGPDCKKCPISNLIKNTFDTGKTVRQIDAKITINESGNQREIQVLASASPVKLMEEERVVLCIQDFTAFRQLQTQLFQAQKMEAIGQLAGGVAHDFNNILAASMMQIFAIQSDYVLNPELSGDLDKLEEMLERAAKLTRQLLVFSRRHILQITRIDLNQVLSEISPMLSRLIGEQIDLEMKPFSKPVWVNADAGMMDQILMNLSINARDAMPKGGPLLISTHLTTLTAENISSHPNGRVGNFAVMTVADCGCGMDEATIKRMFEPFFTTKEPGKGTGIGLATVYEITKKHCGWIEAQSAVGKGTTFQVFIPAAS
jgi:signal transduction histidine kinase